MKKPYSIGSTLYPLPGEKSYGIGGLNYLFGVKSNSTLWLFVDIDIVAAFVISAITGLMNGVKNLSQINT